MGLHGGQGEIRRAAPVPLGRTVGFDAGKGQPEDRAFQPESARIPPQIHF
jgi:hypothetical protein